MIRKDIQYYKFCLYGLLKNLRFYEPFFILFLLSKDLSFLKIGILISIREITVNLLEIPTGLIADALGRKRTMIFSFIFYIFSFLTFYFFSSYGLLAVAMIFYGIGDSFRTGTHKAMIFDYLQRNEMDHLKVEYYGHTRSWSQRGSAISALLAAGIVIVSDGYSMVFLLATIPYLLNLVNIITYPSYLEGNVTKVKFNQIPGLFRDTFRQLSIVARVKGFYRVIINSSVVSGFFDSVESYIQPVLLALAVSLPLLTGQSVENRSALLIGIVYFVIYMLTSWSSRNSGVFRKMVRSEGSGMNISYLIMASAGLIAGFSFHMHLETLSVVFFILLYMGENLRRPICVSKIASSTGTAPLATVLSVDSQLKSFFAMIISPPLGYMADLFGPGLAIAIISVFLLVMLTLFKVKD